MKRLIVVVVLLGAAGAGGWYWWKKSASAAPTYRTAKIEKGDLLVAVTATGTIQPVNQVQVGTQVSGTIQTLGADWNSTVTTKTILAQLDPAPFQARVDQDRANLARSEADIERVQAALTQAESELKRAQDLSKQNLIPASDLDAAVATRDGLVAQMKVAKAVVEQSKATLRVSEVNLQYATIYSPIDGIVISRSVDVGQTVAASFSAPVLFIIADSLKKIQVQASVAEADIGKITVDQDATFTVDAYRERRFKAKVAQIRLQPTTVQNVVTYTVMLFAENKDEKLLPGMTASVSFEVEHAKDVLKVPNAALRFLPAGEAPLADAPAGKRGEGKGEGKPDGKPDGKGEGKPDWKRVVKGRVWTSSPAGPVAVLIELGSTDGSFTVVTKGELTDGQEVITGLAADSKDSGMSNPFAPARGAGGGGGGGRGR